jgi:exodeoxyribonuclease VII large subunit
MHIGVVTSPTGAVIQDIKNVLERRAPLSRITLAPSSVQGDKAENEIIDALKKLQEFDKEEKLDLIIIARGGGSLEDLWCFNSEKIARKIYSLEIPTISAVGHETDYTICDLVSDLRAPTPSAAAEIASQAHSQIINKIENSEKVFIESVKNYIETKSENLSGIINVLKKINFNLDQKIFKIDEKFNKIIFLQKENFSIKKLNLLNKKTALRDKNPLIKLSNQKADLRSKKLIFKNVFNNSLSIKKSSFKALSSKLFAFSPLAVLSRGYTVSTKNDELLDNIKLTEGDEILTRTQQNLISSKITKIDEI